MNEPPSVSVDTFLSDRSTDAVVLDIRDAEAFAEAHIPGAINIYKTDVASTVEKAIPDKTTEIYCHCGGGQSGLKATAMLNEMGYTNAKVIVGGWRSYKGRTKSEV